MQKRQRVRWQKNTLVLGEVAKYVLKKGRDHKYLCLVGPDAAWAKVVSDQTRIESVNLAKPVSGLNPLSKVMDYIDTLSRPWESSL